MKNPPDYWFMLGNIHGNGQPHGILMERYVFLQTPLWEGIPLTFMVPQPSGPPRYEEFMSYGLGNPPSCGEDCKLLWDGFGRWFNGTWNATSERIVDDTFSEKSRGGAMDLWGFERGTRVQLYNAYATWAMCKLVSSASFTNGTDGSVDPYDSVHYKDFVFKPAEDILLDYFSVNHTERLA
ncbi:hypothetical protein OS493_012754 [Desmophyllum pertusum]|uniref:Uncharacterized protein n=1 Tax=Desmophyllum pertusum TaxID=174260 RepID=A0A9X0CXW2_9CNID|nr:hypothetical protein OS493_012754 [Desmophyllum pertusum]